LVNCFSSWNLKRCWPDPTHGIFRRRHRPQVGCFSSHYTYRVNSSILY
jgi:hypothetical protein